jgi:Rrf2 family protein
MISRKGKYALRSALFLARRHGSGPISVDEIAAAEGISRKFLETIMQELKKGGILHSHRGKHGGYTLAIPPQELTLGRILRIIEGALALVRCADGNALCEDCPGDRACLVRLAMMEVSEAVSRVLDHKTLDRLITDGQPTETSITFDI